MAKALQVQKQVTDWLAKQFPMQGEGVTHSYLGLGPIPDSQEQYRLTDIVHGSTVKHRTDWLSIWPVHTTGPDGYELHDHTTDDDYLYFLAQFGSTFVLFYHYMDDEVPHEMMAINYKKFKGITNAC